MNPSRFYDAEIEIVETLLGISAPHARPPYLAHIRKDPCAYCGKKARRGKSHTFDHIQPTSLGGTNSVHNKTACCNSCNNAKGSDSLLIFLVTENLRRLEKRLIFNGT